MVGERAGRVPNDRCPLLKRSFMPCLRVHALSLCVHTHRRSYIHNACARTTTHGHRVSSSLLFFLSCFFFSFLFSFFFYFLFRRVRAQSISSSAARRSSADERAHRRTCPRTANNAALLWSIGDALFVDFFVCILFRFFESSRSDGARRKKRKGEN